MFTPIALTILTIAYTDALLQAINANTPLMFPPVALTILTIAYTYRSPSLASCSKRST